MDSLLQMQKEAKHEARIISQLGVHPGVPPLFFDQRPTKTNVGDRRLAI